MLANLISPVTTGQFFDQYWEQRPLHIKRLSAEFYDQILTRADVDAVIAAGGLRHPSIQIAKGGAFVSPEAFTRTIRSGADVFTGVPDLDRIVAEYQSGATISLPAFHRAWKPLQDMVTAIEAQFDHPAHANVYVTPGNTAGFAPHYDTHEVFVLQISGRKRWWIDPPATPLPHRSQPYQPPALMVSADAIDIELEAGDLLYLPRGFTHSTATSDTASIHVTLGVTVYTWVDLLAEWVHSSRGGQNFRRALPPGFASNPDVHAKLGPELARLATELQARSDFKGLAEAFSRSVLAKLDGTRGTFSSDAVIGLPPESGASD